MGKGGADFSGTFYRTLDSKGRLLLPPGFLRALAENVSEADPSFWLTVIYGRLTAYLPQNWRKTVEQLCRIPMPSPRLSNFKTRVIGLAQEITPDSQGRIRLPQSLLREGRLKRDVVLVGIMEKFEIWDQALFDAIPDEDITDELASRGITITL